MLKVGVKIKVSGKVQMVGFRYSLADLAKQLGLVGWVKNSEDGGVECQAEGNREDLDKLITWCQQGPRLAKVDKVSVDWLEAAHQFDSFEII